jgi:hypothetical protein
MSVFRWIGVAGVAALALACSSDALIGPAGRFDHAAAMLACGPADGPAVAIYFASEPVTTVEPQGDYVRVYVPRTLDEVAAGKTWPIATNSEAAGLYHFANGDYEIAKSGYLTVTSVDTDKTITGTVSLTFPNAGRVQGEFHAEWFQTLIACV